MKKDFFKGNIKREFVSYIWITIIVSAGIGFGAGGFTLYSFTKLVPEPIISGVVMGAFFCLMGIVLTFGTVFVIRKYPKYPKLRSMLLNSDIYFVDSDSKEYRGNRRGRAAFNLVTLAAEQNKDLEDIKYPKKYAAFIALTIIGMILLFVNIFALCLVLDNISMLPRAFQNEYVVFVLFIVFEVVDLILSFLFAFRVKKIREITIEEYRASRSKNDNAGEMR